MPESNACRICGEPLSQPTTGRSRRYCSTTCRRAAEYQLKRLNEHLTRLEWQRDALRRRLAIVKLSAAHRRELEREAAVLDADVERYRFDLARLL